MAAESRLTADQVLALVPHQRPFRFIDELLSIDAQHAVGQYTFRVDDPFYAGHFPDKPITPGVILLESMCQTGLVALGLYLMSIEAPHDELAQWGTIFTDGTAEFFGMVLPGDTVTNFATRIFWRRNKLRARVEMKAIDGQVVALCEVAGMGVRLG